MKNMSTMSAIRANSVTELSLMYRLWFLTELGYYCRVIFEVTVGNLVSIQEVFYGFYGRSGAERDAE